MSSKLEVIVRLRVVGGQFLLHYTKQLTAGGDFNTVGWGEGVFADVVDVRHFTSSGCRIIKSAFEGKLLRGIAEKAFSHCKVFIYSSQSQFYVFTSRRGPRICTKR